MVISCGCKLTGGDSSRIGGTAGESFDRAKKGFDKAQGVCLWPLYFTTKGIRRRARCGALS